MKIEKRGFLNPVQTIQLWIIPTVFYSAQKIAGVKHNELEWLWWALIPAMLIVWFFINWKLKRNEKINRKRISHES